MTQVVVAPGLAVDACLVQSDDGAELVLMVSAAQTITSAVRAAQAVIPSMPAEQVARLVRDHFPHTVELPAVLPGGTSSVNLRPAVSRAVWAMWTMLLVVLVLLALGVGRVVHVMEGEVATRGSTHVHTSTR